MSKYKADGKYISPYSRIEHRETCRILLAAMERLPEQQRSAVILRFWGDLKYAEIAAQLDAPSATVGVWLSRALKRLRATLADHCS